MSVTLDIEGLDSLDAMFQDLPQLREAGVMVEGHAAAYALVWEWGSARIHRPGPKTMWGENPAGESVVLTITAPHGYIRTHHEQYVHILQEEFARIDWGVLSLDDWGSAIDNMLSIAARRCSQLISDAAPIDTGLLRASIHPVEPGDSILNESGGAFDLGADWE
jgi:hypothetical protein